MTSSNADLPSGEVRFDQTSWGASSTRQLPQSTSKVSSIGDSPSVPVAPNKLHSMFDCLLQELAREHARELRAAHLRFEERSRANANAPCDPISFDSSAVPTLVSENSRQLSHDETQQVSKGGSFGGVTLNLQPSVIHDLQQNKQMRSKSQDSAVPGAATFDLQPSLILQSQQNVPVRAATTAAGQSTSPCTQSGKTTKSLAWVERFTDAVKHSVFAHYKEKLGISPATGAISEFFMAKGWWVFHYDSHGEKHRLVKLVQSSQFDNVCAVAILLNAVLLGIAIDQSSKLDNPDDLPFFYEVAALIFTAWFLMELLLRIFADGLCTCFRSRQWGWNMFDGIIVGIDLVHVVIVWQTDTSNNALQNISVIRIFRVFRIARALRIVRLFRFFKDLRMMVMSILKSGSSLVWCCVMLCLIIYVFAIYLMQIVTYHLAGQPEDVDTLHKQELLDSFGSLGRSIYSLFQAVSGGVSWHTICDPLIKVHWSNGLVFCFYIFFTLFAMLNIVTGIFVQSSMTSAQNDHEEVLKEQLHYENSAVQKLKHLFQKVDAARTGNITWEDFEASLHSPEIRAQLAVLGIDIHEAHGIFKLLDLDGSGTLSIEEFVFGCMRMKGFAKNVDLTSLIYEHKRMVDKFSSFFSFAKKEFTRIAAFEKNLEHVLSKEFKSAGIGGSSIATPRSASTTPFSVGAADIRFYAVSESKLMKSIKILASWWRHSPGWIF